MNLFKSKYFKRSINVFANGLNSFLPSISNILISAIVVRVLFPEWWGQITILQLYMYLATQFCAWGNKDTLLKLFSETPSKANYFWMESFSSRFFLLLPVIVGAYFISPNLVSVIHLSVWIFLRYFIQSFDSIILFTRNFWLGIFAEMGGLFVTLITLVFLGKTLSFNHVLLLITIGMLVKTLILTTSYKSYFNLVHSFKPSIKVLKPFFPFMVIGFLGVLQQKADMMSIAWLESEIEIAKYQVFTSFLLFAQSIPGLLITPYIKNLYRLPKATYPKIQQYLVMGGVIISATSTLTIYVAIKFIYQFNFPFTMYILGFLNGLLTYFYMLKIYIMFINNKQKQVMYIGAATIIVNFVLCFVFINKLGLTGAILANVITQILVYVIYKYYLRFNLLIKL